MLVSTTMLELALGRLLRERGLQPGQALGYAELEQDWQRTGLRLADLRDVLREMLDRGMLDCPADSGALEFELTSAGYHYFFQPSPPFAALVVPPAEARTLDQFGHRPRAISPQGLQRRAGERS